VHRKTSVGSPFLDATRPKLGLRIAPDAKDRGRVPALWHFSGMFPRNVLRVVPLRPISRGHGTSSPSSPPWTALRRLLAAPWGLLRVMRAWGSLPIDCRSASVRFTTVAGGEQRLPSSGVFGSMHLVNLVYYAPALSET
jgi:hypothetical protein